MTTRDKRRRDRSRRQGDPAPALSGDQCRCGSWRVIGGGLDDRVRRTCLECGRKWEADR